MAMALALAEAETARDLGEVPIGAVVVGADGKVLAAAGNRRQGIGREPRRQACLLGDVSI